MPAPGAGGVLTSLTGMVQGMMASARAAFRRKPGPTPGATIQSPGGNAPDLTQFSEDFEPSGGLFAPGYPLPPVEPEQLRALDYRNKRHGTGRRAYINGHYQYMGR